MVLPFNHGTLCQSNDDRLTDVKTFERQDSSELSSAVCLQKLRNRFLSDRLAHDLRFITRVVCGKSESFVSVSYSKELNVRSIDAPIHRLPTMRR